jgi:hypothetical protein
MDGIKGFVKSKKGIGTLVGMLLNILVAIGVVPLADDVEKKDVVTGITTLIAAYVLGQGVADHGKEKAKIEAASTDGGTGSE